MITVWLGDSISRTGRTSSHLLSFRFPWKLNKLWIDRQNQAAHCYTVCTRRKAVTCMGAKGLPWYEFRTINQLRKVCLWHISWRRAWDWPFFWFYFFPHFLVHNFYFCAILQCLTIDNLNCWSGIQKVLVICLILLKWKLKSFKLVDCNTVNEFKNNHDFVTGIEQISQGYWPKTVIPVATWQKQEDSAKFEAFWSTQKALDQPSFKTTNKAGRW